jgi:hypothetical protein
MQLARLRGWATVVLGAGLAVTLGVPLLSIAHLPEPLATHWSGSGVPNGSMRLAPYLAVLASVVLVPALLSFPRSGETVGAQARWTLGTVSFVSALVALLSAATVWANWDRARWNEARSIPFALVAATVGVSLLLAILVSGLVRPSFGVQTPARVESPLELGAQERVFWTGSAENRPEALFSVALLVMSALAVQVFELWHMLVLLCAAVMLEHVSKIRVVVNGQRLMVRYGRLGWVRQRIDLRRVLGASAFDLVPMARGGWGYRGSLWIFGRASVVVRRGPALRLELENGRVFSITVEDANTAADLINGLLVQNAKVPGSAPATSPRATPAGGRARRDP